MNGFSFGFTQKRVRSGIKNTYKPHTLRSLKLYSVLTLKKLWKKLWHEEKSVGFENRGKQHQTIDWQWFGASVPDRS